jgi:pSer/pThr/pTyr-binding forkhead associated (FHA) protein
MKEEVSLEEMDQCLAAIPRYGVEIDGAPEGRTVVRLGQSPLVFGRGGPPASDISLYDVHIARRHFVIYWNEQKGRHEVKDYNNVNALRVNGAPLHAGKPHLLEIGDILEIGKFRLRYVEIPASSDCS